MRFTAQLHALTQDAEAAPQARAPDDPEAQLRAARATRTGPVRAGKALVRRDMDLVEANQEERKATHAEDRKGNPLRHRDCTGAPQRLTQQFSGVRKPPQQRVPPHCASSSARRAW